MLEHGEPGRCRLDPLGMAMQQLDLEQVLDIRDAATFFFSAFAILANNCGVSSRS
ncbi:hypothetical protein ACVWWO_007502 [Bradyrhizobium sp. F1.13.1]